MMIIDSTAEQFMKKFE